MVTGRVESGTVSPGDTVTVAGSEARVRTVERATPDDHVGLELEGVGSGGVRGADSAGRSYSGLAIERWGMPASRNSSPTVS